MAMSASIRHRLGISARRIRSLDGLTASNLRYAHRDAISIGIAYPQTVPRTQEVGTRGLVGRIA
jgi:hypothetical protein